jgi:hypothetical protein
LPDAHEPERSGNWTILARTRLAQRRTEKPLTKAGQIRALWPEIDAALSGGQSMKSILRWLEEDAGIALGITSLTSYISRIRRREKSNRRNDATTMDSVRGDQTRAQPVLSPLAALRPLAVRPQPSPASVPPDDPLAQAMRALSKRAVDIREIHNDGDPGGRKLI